MNNNCHTLSIAHIKSFLKNQFINHVGYTPDFDKPLSFNEKINWLKLYDRNPLAVVCADKYLVRDYVENKIGSKYLVNILGVYDNADEIDFESLPNRFVIKVNWGSGQNIICKDKSKLDINEVLSKIDFWMRPENNLYFYSYEWCYKDIKPKIIIEEFIEQLDGKLLDYKFFCYNGKVKNLFVASDRGESLKCNFYNIDWELYPFTRMYPNNPRKQFKPKEFDEMVSLAEKLSEPFIFARVDFYIVKDEVKFGEITFYPGAGLEPFQPLEWDYRFGKYIELPYETLIKNIKDVKDIVAIDYNNIEKDNQPTPYNSEYGDFSLINYTGGVNFIMNIKNNIFSFNKGMFLENYLVTKESIFGGYVNNVKRNTVSPHDTRTKEEIQTGGMIGGDRFYFHGYAQKYSQYLQSFIINDKKVVIAEIGILLGTGLAVWCDLFKNSRILGFDIDLANIKNNMDNLKQLGAFRDNMPELYKFDQFENNKQLLDKILNGDKVDICIDNGFHSHQTIINSLNDMLPFLADDFVYFIEDNDSVYPKLKEMFPQFRIESCGDLTIISNKPSILFFSHSPILGGAERSLYDIVTKLSRKGIICNCILPASGLLENLLKNAGVPTYISPTLSSWFASQSEIEWKDINEVNYYNLLNNIDNDLLPIVKKIGPSAIYSQTVVSPIGAIVAKKMKVPHILSAREYGVLDHGLYFRFGFKNSMKALYDDSDLIFTVTNDVKKVLFGEYDQSKVHTVYSSVIIDHNKNNTDAIFRLIDKNDVVKLLVPANITESKRQMDVVMATELLIKKGYKIRLLLIGNSVPIYLNTINNYIREHNLEEYIKIEEFRSDVLSAYTDADVIISASICEALGRTMLEAALLKVPFIYANSGGPKEVFKHNIHALAYEPSNFNDLAEKIATAIDNPTNTKKLAENAYTFVKSNFNDNNYVEKQYDLITNLLNTYQYNSDSFCLKLIEDNLDYKFLANKYSSALVKQEAKKSLGDIEVFLSDNSNFVQEFAYKVNENEASYSFVFPQVNFNINSIRLDIGSIYTSFYLKEIIIYDKHGKTVWQWDGDLHVFEYNDIILTERIIYCNGNDPQIILPKFQDNADIASLKVVAENITKYELIQQFKEKVTEEKQLVEIINKCKNEVELLQNNVDILNSNIIQIKSTKGYRILEINRKIIRKILPQGTIRRKIIKFFFYKPLKLIYKTLLHSYRFGFRSTLYKVYEYLKIKIRTKKINLCNSKHDTTGVISIPNTDEKNRQRNYSFTKKMKISIIVPVYNTDKIMLIEMIESCINQTYENWELCIADASDDFHRYVFDICHKYIKNDNRIKYIKLDKNLGISENSNKAYEISTGELITLLDHDDVLHPSAFYEIMLEVQKGSDFIYTDEALFSNSILHPKHIYYKPDFSPNLLLSQNYITHLIAFRRELLGSDNLLRSEYDGAQDYDLILRLSKVAKNIKHIPSVLYFWRMHQSSTSSNPESKLYADDAGASAIQYHLDTCNLLGKVERPQLFQCSVNFDLTEKIKVSIIIPMKDKYELTDTAVKSIISKSTYSNYEIIILNNNSVEEVTRKWFQDIKLYDERVVVIDANFEFNWSKLNNFGIQNASGDVFIFLNNDTEVITPDWIERLSSYALQENIGVVGALLLYPDDTIQHAGVVVGMNGYADHIYKGESLNNYPYYFVNPFLVRNVLAVTGACMAISKKCINKIGLFDEEFIICGSDVEICIRAYENGYYNVYNPEVRLYHYESKSRDSFIPEIDFVKSLKAYSKYLEGKDPFYNSNLPIYIDNMSGKNITPADKINFETVPDYFPDLKPINLKKGVCTDNKYRLNLLVPSLNIEHVFGGISTALSFARNLAGDKYKLRIIITNVGLKSEAASKYKQWELISLHNRVEKLDVHEKDIFIATAWWTAYILTNITNFQMQMFNKSNNIIYLIQDYEPGFYQWSSNYLMADSTYKNDNITAVFNSKSLYDFFNNNGYTFSKEYFFEPVINKTLKEYIDKDIKLKRKKQILIYGRPSVARNAFEIIIMALKKWVIDYDIKDWNIISLGEKHANFYLNDNVFIQSYGKVSLEEYANFMLESFMGISLMVSPHPSYPPLEMSTFGMKVITNNYANKNLENFNDNIISLDNLSPENIARTIAKVADEYHEYTDFKINCNYMLGDKAFNEICIDIMDSLK